LKRRLCQTAELGHPHCAFINDKRIEGRGIRRKHRFNQEDEFVIGGYIPGGQNFSELLIGEERDKELIFIKRLIAGFVPHTRAEVFEAIKGLRTSTCPFGNLPEGRKSPHALTEEVMRQCVWLKPERRCEVEFVERTKGGRLRHAEFRRLVG
jgi:ATP-dependent DNA ligase